MHTSHRTPRVAAMLVFLLLALLPARAGEDVRRAIGAGPMYPLETDKLTATLDRLFEEADPPAPYPGRLVGCIVPHDPYGLSGRVAAAAFKNVAPGDHDKVLVLGACHRTIIESCSVPSVVAYVTPLGFVPLAERELGRLCRSSLISARGLRYDHNDFRLPLHEIEHSIEMVLPFLQRRLGPFELMPMLVGDMNQSISTVGGFDGVIANEGRADAAILTVADLVRDVLDDRTLMVVSSNLTHFGNDFSFRPPWILGDIEGGIERLDMDAIQLILSKDWRAFEEYLRKTGNPICGATAIKLMLELLPANARGLLMDYDTSANRLRAVRREETISRSVSYAAINFYVPVAPPHEVKDQPPATFTRETMEAWEAARAAREAAGDGRPRPKTLRLSGQYEGAGGGDVWVSEEKPLPETPAAPEAKPPAGNAQPAAPAPTSGTPTIVMRSGKLTIEVDGAAP